MTGRADYHENPLVLEWWTGRRVPIAMAAHGPRMFRLAGRVADIVVSGIGLGSVAREFAAEHVAAGARDAGRDPSEIEMWYLTYVNLGEDRDRASRDSASVLAVAGNLLRGSRAVGIIPDRLRSSFVELGRRYSYVKHASATVDDPNGQLIQDLGLGDYLTDAFGIFGSAGDVRARLVELNRSGVDSLWSGYVRPDLTDFLSRWGAEVWQQGVLEPPGRDDALAAV